MKDSPAIILASGLAGLVGAFFPTAQGWLLDQSMTVMNTEISAHSLGLFSVSRFLFVPALAVTILGALSMTKKFATPPMGLAAALCSVGTLLAWYLQKVTIEHFSAVGIGPALGLFLLLVSGLGGVTGGVLLAIWPPGGQAKSQNRSVAP